MPTEILFSPQKEKKTETERSARVPIHGKSLGFIFQNTHNVGQYGQQQLFHLKNEFIGCRSIWTKFKRWSEKH